MNYKMDETQKEDVYMTFLKLGPNRTLRDTARMAESKFPANHPPLAVIQNWAIAGRWEELAELWDQRVKEREESWIKPTPVMSVQTQIDRCEKAMDVVWQKGDMKSYHAFFKLQCELAGLLVRKEQIIVKNVDSMSREELQEVIDDSTRKLKQLADVGGDGSPAAQIAERAEDDGASGEVPKTS